MSETHYAIHLTDKSLVVSKIADLDCRKSTPSLSQKDAETIALKIHAAVKGCSVYERTVVRLESIDWYESCNEFLVAGAVIGKGQRSVRDLSAYSNNIPKDWNLITSACFAATSRTTRPLTDTFKAMGLPVVLVADVQKMLKKNNGSALIIPEIGSRRGMFGWPESYIKGYKVAAEMEY